MLNVMRVPEAAKRRLTVMLLAKQGAQPELRQTLEEIGLKVVAAESFDAVTDRPDVDFVIPLLDHAGFTHSEMLAPLLLTRHGIPFLGASPIIRGLAEDTHLSKLTARARGVPTPDWKLYRRQAGAVTPPEFFAERLIVKPNAASAARGIAVFDNWNEAVQHVRWLHERGHDALVEEWTALTDISVPVIGGAMGRPWILPPMAHAPGDPLARVEDLQLVARLETLIAPLLEEFWPFDYGRFAFRFDPRTGSLSFLEVNLSGDLGSQQTISQSARTLGLSHRDVVETIVAHSLGRQRLIAAARPCPVY